MRVLSPMSQDDEAESRQRIEYGAEEDVADEGNARTKRWRRTIEQALVKMTAEIAALREQIATGREYQGKKRKSPARWIGWFMWIVSKHFLTDVLILGIILLWLRKRKDLRIEDLVRQGLKIVREYARKILPAR